MLLCSCRPHEASECKRSDVSILEGVPVLHIRGTKTANADRYVPMPDWFFDLIKNINEDEHIAVYSNGCKITDENRWRLWRRFKEVAELNASSEDLTPYCLRHEYCTMCARKGVDIRVAQRLMGHSSIELTANIYTHVETLDLVKGYHIW
ncbi:MAG: tyrosine-type recombinase/integrase [Bacilli bacterium]|nr:tyrosine-type recombinase/integrase [Bacilli bacterium]